MENNNTSVCKYHGKCETWKKLYKLNSEDAIDQEYEQCTTELHRDCSTFQRKSQLEETLNFICCTGFVNAVTGVQN
jgi:hypothetical protein